jgi:hypothetical protein
MNIKIPEKFVIFTSTFIKVLFIPLITISSSIIFGYFVNNKLDGVIIDLEFKHFLAIIAGFILGVALVVAFIKTYDK